MQKVLPITLLLALIALAAVAQDAPPATVTLQLGESERFGDYLTDGNGRSLYLFLEDDVGSSTCTDRCAATWPPLLTQGEVVAREGLDRSLVGTTQRRDGTLQVTYNGWPLYRFSRDVGSFTGGQGAGGTWFLISPEGAGVGAPGATDAEAQAETEQVDPMVLGEMVGRGRPIYATHCAACHGEAGGGGQGVRLDGNDRLADEEHVVVQILGGSRFMPRYDAQLSNEEIAAVATFIRNSWGNEYGPIMEQEVSSQRDHN